MSNANARQYRDHPNSPCAQPAPGFPSNPRSTHWSKKAPFHNNGTSKKDKQ